ncbi:MAG: methylated-DNA--[Prevotella sp.]|nr:methylated-DNA--[protein]-cysteine S-methyltransferase [Prevotella sp.]
MEDRNLIQIQHYHSPCGHLVLGSFDHQLCLCDWGLEKHRPLIDQRFRRIFNAEYVEDTSDVLEEAKRQLDEYFSKQRTKFNIPLLFIGTDFQKSVWKELLKISYGTTTSYGELAKRIGIPGAVRAVANANGANAISIFVPCHRVIGSNHSLTGYAGGLSAKRFLLDLESEKLL